MLRASKKWVAIGILVFVQSQVISQSLLDISGDWKGVASVSMASDIEVVYHFVQNSSVLTGYGVHKSLNGKDSSKYLIEGLVNSDKVIFTGTRYEYKVGPGCLSKVTFLISSSNRERLSGKWSGDWSIKTCPPGAGGELVVFKSKDEIAAQVSSEISTAAIQDDYAEALVTELQKRKYYALIIGIDDYADENIADLSNPLTDAKSLQKVLTEYYGFLPENTAFLSNPTRDEIIDQFDDLASELTSRDQLLIFYAGHGIWDERIKQGYWLPSDASKTSKSRWLSNSTIRDYIGGIRSKHTLLISDACFSGGIFRERGLKLENGNALLQLYNLPSRKAITSGTLTTVPDKSVFIKYLLKQLQLNPNKLTSAEELYRSFRIAVINNSVNGQVPQYGAIGQVGDEGGDFIFLRRSK